MKQLLLLLSFVLGLSSCQPSTQNNNPYFANADTIQTGGIKFITVDGKYKVWTKKVGDGKIKVLLLHGGPGCTHEYFECFESFFPQEGIEFYYYDQLGSYYSDQPNDTSLWRVDRFREEVEQVRKGLGLENFYLYGQSWGGMLAIEYALKYQQHLKALVISNMTASIDSYVKYATVLKSQLPSDVLAKMNKYESKGDYENSEYQDIIFNKVYTKHLCRIQPWPDPVNRTFKHFATPVYNTMQGPNEFVITGNFKNWNVWNKLKNINVPTLLISGKYDTMNPDDIKQMSQLIPNSRFVLCPNGSHFSLYDDQQFYFKALIRFLKDVDEGAFKKE